MNVYKPKKADGTLYINYYVCYVDHLGIRRKLSGFKDKNATQSLGRMLEKLVSYKSSNRPFDQELISWIESINPRFIKNFIEIGLIDYQTSAVIKPLMIAKRVKRKHAGKDILIFEVSEGHLADYMSYLEAEGRTKDHIRESINHNARFFDSQRILYSTGIIQSKIQAYLADFKATGVSAARINAAISAIKAFCNWMFKENRMLNNPGKGIKKLNVKADRRYVRDVLSQNEVDKLLRVLPDTSLHHGLEYQSRSIIYKLGLKAGLRWNEIYTLKRNDFSLDTQPATVTVRAENEKAGRGATLPLEKSLATDLREYFAANQAINESQAIKGMWKKKGAEMLREDLKSAGIDPIRADSGKIIDFHGLRHTYGTMLAQAGVMPAQLKRLMRHSNVQITMDYYTHLSIDHLSTEIAKISGVSNKSTEKCTIPENTAIEPVESPIAVNSEKCGDSCGSVCGADYVTFRHISAFDGFSDLENDENKKAISTLNISVYGSNLVAPPAGLEPATHGLTVHCSTN